MKSEINFNDIVARLKNSLQIKDDKDLAKLLNMTPATFHGRKKAGSIPYDAIFSLANMENIDYNWLLTGEGSMYKNALSEPSAGYEVSLKVLYPELTDKEVQMFETEIEEKIEFSRLKKIVYERFSGV